MVITGLSGCGKSTLAFDTVFAEGQRKYMESLSAYARQFLDQLQKPDIDEIEGLPPTIAIEQRIGIEQPAFDRRDDDGDLRLPARALRPRRHAALLGVRPGDRIQTPSQIVDAVMKYPAGTKVMILSPLIRGQKGEHKETFGAIHKQGFVRARVDGEIVELQTPAQFPAAEENVRPQHRSDRRSHRAQAGDPLAPGRLDRDRD